MRDGALNAAGCPSLVFRYDMGVTCSSCGTENPERARFCMGCGSALAFRCPHCGAEAQPGAKFCIECGGTIGDAAAAPAPPEEQRAEPLPEERRQVSVLFADLSGYTAMAEQMDPEAVKA